MATPADGVGDLVAQAPSLGARWSVLEAFLWRDERVAWLVGRDVACRALGAAKRGLGLVVADVTSSPVLSGHGIHTRPIGREARGRRGLQRSDSIRSPGPLRLANGETDTIRHAYVAISPGGAPASDPAVPGSMGGTLICVERESHCGAPRRSSSRRC